MEPSKLHMVRSNSQGSHLSQSGRGSRTLQCPDCDNLLEVHQPESGFPDRMLGTCHECHRWFVADFVTGQEEGIIVFLPDAKFFLSQS